MDPKTAYEPFTTSSYNITKAGIRVENRDGKQFFIKDYSAKNITIRLCYGRYTLRREAKAYSKLSGIKGFPRCYGLEDKDKLVLQYIQGRSLRSFKRGAVPDSVFDRLDNLIHIMHSRGVANCDLHRSNVLITDSGDVYIVDFASAFISNGANLSGLLIKFFMQLDLHSAARIKAHFCRQKNPMPKGFFGFIYRAIKYFKFFRR
jgi:predicted Ser/Thr protein kinase